MAELLFNRLPKPNITTRHGIFRHLLEPSLGNSPERILLDSICLLADTINFISRRCRKLPFTTNIYTKLMRVAFLLFTGHSFLRTSTLIRPFWVDTLIHAILVCLQHTPSSIPARNLPYSVIFNTASRCKTLLGIFNNIIYCPFLWASEQMIRINQLDIK